MSTDPLDRQLYEKNPAPQSYKSPVVEWENCFLPVFSIVLVPDHSSVDHLSDFRMQEWVKLESEKLKKYFEANGSLSRSLTVLTTTGSNYLERTEQLLSWGWKAPPFSLLFASLPLFRALRL